MWSQKTKDRFWVAFGWLAVGVIYLLWAMALILVAYGAWVAGIHITGG